MLKHERVTHKQTLIFFNYRNCSACTKYLKRQCPSFDIPVGLLNFVLRSALFYKLNEHIFLNSFSFFVKIKYQLHYCLFVCFIQLRFLSVRVDCLALILVEFNKWKYFF